MHRQQGGAPRAYSMALHPGDAYLPKEDEQSGRFRRCRRAAGGASSRYQAWQSSPLFEAAWNASRLSAAWTRRWRGVGHGLVGCFASGSAAIPARRSA